MGKEEKCAKKCKKLGKAAWQEGKCSAYEPPAPSPEDVEKEAIKACAKKYKKACTKDRDCKNKKDDDKKEKCAKKCKKLGKAAWQEGKCSAYEAPAPAPEDPEKEAIKACAKKYKK